MKTIAVLAALAAVATAVPALPGYSSYEYRSAPYRLPASVRREKKSPELLQNEEGTIDSVMSQLDTTPEEEARTLFFKKPIITKKKVGYPLYRDEEQENEFARASEDAREKCAKEFKVKFCEAENLAESTAQMRSADEDSSITDVDMKQNINIARNAVEKLQKATQFQNVNLDQDTELHKDIEVARQALEHIQKSFGNLQSMNLQARTLSEAEALKGEKIEEKRMAQWKEAIENTQENAEIPRNVEDNFKTAEFPKSETEAKESLPENQNSAKIAADIEIATPSVADDKKSLDIKRNAEQTDLMTPAASEVHEVQVALQDIPVKAKEASLDMDGIKANEAIDMDIKAENANLDKNSHINMEMSDLMKKKLADHVKVETKNAAETMEGPTKLKTSGIVDDLSPASSVPVLRTVSMANSNVHDAEMNVSDENKKNILPKSIETSPVDDKNIGMVPHMNHGKTAVIDTTLLMKSNENNAKLDFHKDDVMQVKESSLDHLKEPKLADNHRETISNVRSNEENNLQQHLTIQTKQEIQQITPQSLPSLKSADQHSPAINGKVVELSNLHPEVRAPEMENTQQQLQESSDLRFQTQGKSWHVDQMTPKSKALEDVEAARTAHMGVHVQPMMEHAMMQHEHAFVQPVHHMQPFLHQHHHGPHMGFMGHGKSADLDSVTAPSSQVNVNEDMTSKAALNHGSIMNWKQKEGARGAYGLGSYGAAAAAAAAASAAASAGASGLVGVGGSEASALSVFPGARLDGCAIPLLLSCSPSVVRGTLAKPAAYAAPHAYRSAGDFNHRFHNKRDTKKLTEIVNKIKKTPTKVIQRIPLEKKL